MRTLNQLYCLIKSNYVFTSSLGSVYICNAIKGLCLDKIITKGEEKKIFSHFYKQYPTETKHPEFYFNPLFRKIPFDIDDAWFRQSTLDSSQYNYCKIRNDFLAKMIKITTKELGSVE